MSTQVWEHVEEPYKLMRKVYDILDGGCYIDVPIMRYHSGEYYSLFAEHLNYWTVNSVAKLMDMCGFEILSIGEVLDGNHIGCIARKQLKDIDFEERFRQDADMVINGKKVGIWGAGIKGRIFFKRLGEQNRNIIHWFDADADIEGLYTQNFYRPIELPNEASVNECEMIVITAIQYKNEIIEVIRKQFNYNGEIRCIGEM